MPPGDPAGYLPSAKRSPQARKIGTPFPAYKSRQRRKLGGARGEAHRLDQRAARKVRGQRRLSEFVSPMLGRGGSGGGDTRRRMFRYKGGK